LGFNDATLTVVGAAGNYQPTVSDSTLGPLYGAGITGASVDRRFTVSDLNPGSIRVKQLAMQLGSSTLGSYNQFGDINPNNPNVNNDKSVFVKRDSCLWEIRNNDNQPCYITVYKVVCKRALPVVAGVSDSICHIFNNGFKNIKDDAVASTGVNTATAGSVRAMVNNIAITSGTSSECNAETITGLEGNRLFMKFFKLVKVKKAYMKPGVTVKVKYSKDGYWINSLTNAIETQADYVCGKGQVYHFIKVEGIVGHSTNVDTGVSSIAADRAIERNTIVTGNFTMLDIVMHRDWAISTPLFKPRTYFKASALNTKTGADGTTTVTKVEAVNYDDPNVDAVMTDGVE